MACPVCGSDAQVHPNHERNTIYYACPVCGNFEIDASFYLSDANTNHLAAYLCYHNDRNGKNHAYRYYTTLSKEECDRHRAEFNKGYFLHSLPVHFDAEMIESWFPKSFSERIDYILLYLHNRIPHIGQRITMDINEVRSMLFVDRKEIDSNPESTTRENMVLRSEMDCIREVQYMLDYLQKMNYIHYSHELVQTTADITLLPEGYSRIDTLLKNTSNGRNVLVAMKFGDDTRPLREAIRKGITDAGYHAILIDEVEHNDFITPELLKHIRDSKFVVVDLTHKNNGAYFEEGYAMGLGKPVIQLCKKDVQLHFDIAQKNTIIWQTEDDIPERLRNRIKATID